MQTYPSLNLTLWPLIAAAMASGQVTDQGKPVDAPAGLAKSADVAASPDETKIPTSILQLGGGEAEIPDWSKISFASLPALSQANTLGELSWSKGEGIEQLLKLQDFEQTFQLQNLSLFTIGLKTQLDPEEMPLASFRLLRHQTIESLVQAVPGLGNYPVPSIPPIAALLQQIKPSYQLQELTPLSLVIKDPELGRISFANFDATLFKIKDVPGLTQSPLSAFTNWQLAGIDDIPGLRSMPWDGIVRPIESTALIGVTKILDFTSADRLSISGSDAEGYEVPCPTDSCMAIGFDGNTVLQNRQWILGTSQSVSGGEGKLAAAGRGLEPTGRNVYGDAFKIVITDITPTVIKTALYFRHCENPSVLADPSCSPYAIGPIPFQQFQPGDPMLVGAVNLNAINHSIIESDTNVAMPIDPPPSPLSQKWWFNLYQSVLAFFVG
jgi:hypothetical protein